MQDQTGLLKGHGSRLGNNAVGALCNLPVLHRARCKRAPTYLLPQRPSGLVPQAIDGHPERSFQWITVPRRQSRSVRMILDLPDLDATRQLGYRLAELLFPGTVIALVGSLGAGKTHPTRAVVEGLGGAERAVVRPTFTLNNE